MVVSAYVSQGAFNGLREGDNARLTHINIAFAKIKDGKASVDHWQNTAPIKELLNQRGKLKIVLSVGGWGADGFSPAVATAKGRELLAQSLMDIVEDYGFDGIDMDWEYPCSNAANIEASQNDKQNYTLLMQLLRQKLGTGRLLTMACGATQKRASDLEIMELVPLLDYFNLMTYDMCPQDKVGHHADLTTGIQVAKTFADAGVPMDKLVLGAAFYACVYDGVSGLGAPLTGPLEYRFLKGGYAATAKRAASVGESFDPIAKAPYIYDVSTREFITYDNPESLAAKVQHIKTSGMGGIMFWEYSYDDTNSSLLKAIAIP